MVNCVTLKTLARHRSRVVSETRTDHVSLPAIPKRAVAGSLVVVALLYFPGWSALMVGIMHSLSRKMQAIPHNFLPAAQLIVPPSRRQETRKFRRDKPVRAWASAWQSRIGDC